MTPPPPRLHRRQFMIGPEPLLIFSDWRSHELSDGLYVSWDPDLDVVLAGDRALLGIAAQTDPDRPTPADELAGSPDPDAWAGRFVLLDRGRVIVDAGATLGVFFRSVGGVTWTSSSPELLRGLAPELPRPRAPLEHGVGMEWYPPPGSGVPALRRVLPSQILILPAGRVEARDALPAVTARAPDEVLALLERRLVTALKGLSLRGRLALGLTAGRDTRLVLAAAAISGIDAFTYTFWWPHITSSDLNAPPALARAAGLDHRLIERGALDPERLTLWDRHTCLHSADADREYFACGQLDALAASAVEVGASVFEVPTSYYAFAFPDPELPRTPQETARLVLREMPARTPDDVLAWAQWIHDTPVPWMTDWRDRFSLEQRVGGWLGSIAQGVDLAPLPAVHLANSRAYLSDTLALPYARRRHRAHQTELVRRMVPALDAIPYNAPDPLAARARTRVRRELSELRAQRSAKRYLAHRVRRWRNARNG